MIVGLALVAVIGAIVIYFVQKKKESAAVVQTQKLPVQTPIGSPRGDKEVPSATMDDMENAGFDDVQTSK